MKDFDTLYDCIERANRAEVTAEEAVTQLQQAMQPRFGAIPKATAARLLRASRAEFNRWADRFLRWQAFDQLVLFILKVTSVSPQRLGAVFDQHVGHGSAKRIERIVDRIRRESWAEGWAEGRAKVIAENRQKGAATVLQKLLRRRFGAIPKKTVTRVTRASSADIDRWVERVLDAATLAEVFAD